MYDLGGWVDRTYKIEGTCVKLLGGGGVMLFKCRRVDSVTADFVCLAPTNKEVVSASVVGQYKLR